MWINLPDDLIRLVFQSCNLWNLRLVCKSFDDVAKSLLISASGSWDSFLTLCLYRKWKTLKCPFDVGANVQYRSKLYTVLDVDSNSVRLWSRETTLMHYFSLPWKLLMFHNEFSCWNCACLDALHNSGMLYQRIRSHVNQEYQLMTLRKRMAVTPKRFAKVLKHSERIARHSY